MRINDHFKYLNIGLPEDILRRKMHGDFEGAIRLIDQKLAQEIPEALRSCLIVQREIISRVEADYPYTKEEAIAIIREHIPDFEESEFDEMLFGKRDEQMAQKLIKLLEEEEGTYFVVVGAGHFLVDKNIRYHLEQNGYDVEPFYQ